MTAMVISCLKVQLKQQITQRDFVVQKLFIANNSTMQSHHWGLTGSCPSWLTHILIPSQYASYYLNHHQYCPGRKANICWYLDSGDGQSIINPILKSNQINV